MNKVLAPSLLLEDFNYLFNKAINLYINKKYNIYDISQLTTDDLRVLKSSCVLNANTNNLFNDVTVKNSMWGAIYEFLLPLDYLHLLSCICNYHVRKPFKCYDAGTYVQFPATRLTADMWSLVINNFYMRPMYKRPYYYINNINHQENEYYTKDETGKVVYPSYGGNGYLGGPMIWEDGATKDTVDNTATSYKANIPSSEINLPTDPSSVGGTDAFGVEIVQNGITTLNVDGAGKLPYADLKTVKGGIPREIKIGTTSFDGVERVGKLRYGNPSTVRLEIRYGNKF